MSTNIKLKRSAVAGKIPTTLNLEFGEVAINTNDGKLFFKKDDGTEAIVTIQETTKTLVDSLNVDADTLDGLNSSQFLRSDANDTANGDITFNGSISFTNGIQINSLITIDAESAITSSTAQTQIASFAAVDHSSGKFLIQSTDAVSGEVHITELLVVHDGNTAIATEYGTVHTGTNPLATYDVDINSGVVRILATAVSSNNTTFKVSETLITI